MSDGFIHYGIVTDTIYIKGGGGGIMKQYKKMSAVVAKSATKTYAYAQCGCNC